jgi:LysM repeat protein
VRSSIAGVLALAAVGISACGGPSLADPFTTDSVAAATDFKTFPPPTTTLPPTTTTPPEPGSILDTEATYEIVSGDYPYVVADRFAVDFDAFVALNGWTIEDGEVPEWPQPGTIIRIPAGATIPDGPSVLVPVTTLPTDSDSSAPAGSDSVPGTSTETATTVDNGIGCGTYTIVEGDYLGRVATKLGTTVEELDDANDDTDGYGAFYVGLKINVPC